MRAGRYATAWAPYVWPVSGIDDLKVAPFHLLASEGRVWFDQDHVWHMTLADRLAEGEGQTIAEDGKVKQQESLPAPVSLKCFPIRF